MRGVHDGVAVVTGANGGIGKAIALGLAKSGAYVCLVGRNLRKLEAVRWEDKTIASQFGCYQADLSLDNDLRTLTRKIQRKFKKIDVLVHSAGVISLGRIEDASIKDLDKHFAINVRAPYYLTQRLLPLLKQSHGQIIFINSSVALRTAGEKVSQYTITKYALRALADSLRAEINRYGIRVITIYPGQTATEMQKRVQKLKGRSYEPDNLLQTTEIASVVLHALTQPKTAEVTDISIRPFRNSY
ncbi:MAG: SDR family oxidoreductase [Anaerolineales bacterium]